MESALKVVVALWWISIFAWVAFSESGHRRVPLAIGAFALSATLYIPEVADLVSRLIGSSKPCNEFENIWGVVTSGVTAAILASGYSRRFSSGSLVLAIAAGFSMAALAYLEQPTPVGCIASLGVSSADPYWWIIVSSHIGFTTVAVVICVRDGRAIRSVSRIGAVAVWGIGLGFFSSIVFWSCMGTVLVDRTSRAAQATENVFIVTVFVMSTASAVGAIVALRRYFSRLADVRRSWDEYQAEFAAGLPGRGLPSLTEIAGSWWLASDRVLHAINIARRDLELTIAARASEGGEPHEQYDG